MPKEYPLNYVFTGDCTPAKINWPNTMGDGTEVMIVGYEDVITYWRDYPVPDGFVLVQMPNGNIQSIHGSKLK